MGKKLLLPEARRSAGDSCRRKEESKANLGTPSVCKAVGKDLSLSEAAS